MASGRHGHRHFPDPKVCRTECVDRNLYHCLIGGPARCQFAIWFNPKSYCRHPDRRKFEQPQPVTAK